MSFQIATQGLLKNLETIRKRHLYSIICDEATNCSNIEQLNIRTVSENLERQEDFLGFNEVHNNKSDTIVAAMKYKILRLNISFEIYYNQIYDAASNMGR